MNDKTESLLLKRLMENYTSLENKVYKLELANDMQAQAIIRLTNAMKTQAMIRTKIDTKEIERKYKIKYD